MSKDKPSITLDDIARLSGYSRSTVSRVLTNSSHVSPKAKTIISRVMEEHHFTGNAIARGMVIGKMPIVMVIAGDVANYFYANAISQIERMLFKKGYLVAVCTSEYSARKELAYLKMATMFRVSAVVLMSAVDSAELSAQIRSLDCPLISMNRRLSDCEIDMVLQKNYDSAYLAVRHLIRNGHTDIAHLAGIQGTSTAAERTKGYLQALRDYKIRSSIVRHGDLTWQSGYQFGEDFANGSIDCTAVFISNDTMTAGFVKAVSDAGRSIPDDVSLICFDYSPVIEQLAVQVSTVGCTAQKIGIETARMVTSRLECPDGPKQTMELDGELKERNSVKRLNRRTQSKKG